MPSWSISSASSRFILVAAARHPPLPAMNKGLEGASDKVPARVPRVIIVTACTHPVPVVRCADQSGGNNAFRRIQNSAGSHPRCLWLRHHAAPVWQSVRVCADAGCRRANHGPRVAPSPGTFPPMLISALWMPCCLNKSAARSSA